MTSVAVIMMPIRNKAGKPVTHLCTFPIRSEAMRATGYFRDWFVNAFDLDLQYRLAAERRVGTIRPSIPTTTAGTTRRRPTRMATSRLEFLDACGTEFTLQRAATVEEALLHGKSHELPAHGLPVDAQRNVVEQITGHIEATAWLALAQGQRDLGNVRGISQHARLLRRWRRFGVKLTRSALRCH